jgi:hypothetical protein
MGYWQLVGIWRDIVRFDSAERSSSAANYRTSRLTPSTKPLQLRSDITGIVWTATTLQQEKRSRHSSQNRITEASTKTLGYPSAPRITWRWQQTIRSRLIGVIARAKRTAIIDEAIATTRFSLHFLCRWTCINCRHTHCPWCRSARNG